MDKTVIGLDEQELQRLNVIIVDKDADAALAFLRDVVLRKIKDTHKGTGCHPQYDA